MSGRTRVAVFSELPTPYRWPIFARLLDSPGIDLRIFFCARTESDRDFRFDFRPDERVRFLPVRTFSIVGRRTVHYHVNPTVFGVLARSRFDVVVFPGYAMFASQVGALWCRCHRTPYVIFSETTHLGRRDGFRRALKRAVLPAIVGGASAWLATGKLSREYLASFGADEARTFRFPNTPDVEAFRDAAAAADRCAIRARHGAGDAPVVLFVARLIGVKRADLLVSAMARLERKGVRAPLWIAGDGPERAGLAALAEREGLSSVRFLGNVPTADLPGLYAAADLFVLPSDHEPWGAVVNEAMACGLPVVLSDRVGSGPDLVDGENGGVFPAGDAEALAREIEGILLNADKRKRMSARSAERIGRFTHQVCAREFLEAVETARRSGSRCRTAASSS